MKKQPATKKTPVHPDQILAMRRLAKSGRVSEALGRLDKLIEQHPAHKPLYGLAWEIAGMAKHPAWAIERALEWTHASPHSQAAWQALAEDAMAAGYLALGFSAQGRLNELTGAVASALKDLETPFGTMSIEEAIANDTARVYMATARFDKALAALAGFDHVSLRNNAALIRFQQEDVGRALAAFEENWQREPRNLFALEHVVRLRLWMRGRDAAAGLAVALKSTPAERSDDALAKLNALLILGDWQAADAAWRASADADFWQGPQEIDKSAAFDFAGGVAAWRLGDFEAMSERLGDAAEGDPNLRETVKRIEWAAVAPETGEAPDIAMGALVKWFPQTWIDRLYDLKTRKGRETDDRCDALMRECDAHPDYLGVTAEFGGESGCFLAISILKLRAREGDETARQTLIDLLARPCGPDKVRTRLHVEMVEAGLLPEGGTVSMFAQGKLREIRHLAMKIHAEASPPSLPPASHARLVSMYDLMAHNKLKECCAILEDLIARHPEVPLLHNNLAGVKEGLGHPESEIEALLQKAHALDPDYLFAIAGLARLAARRGERERAKSMLEPLLGRDSYHFTEWRSILMTQIELAKAQGEFGAALNLQKQILELQERFG